jgi:uncharacterized membrane protein
MKKDYTEIALGCLLLVLLVVVLTIVSGIIFTLVWNIAIPAVFGGPTLSFIEGTAVMFLLRMIGAAFRAVVSSG